MINSLIAIVVIIGTILAYLAAKGLYDTFKHPLLLPVTVATTAIIIVLLMFNISYETYMIGGQWIHHLLGPAVVSLAFPLYENRRILKELLKPLVVGTFTGSLVGITTGVYLAKLVGVEAVLLYSVAPKSVTTPVAMDISTTIGGIDSLAAVFVMIAGMSGTMLSTYVYEIFRFTSPVARGVGLGSASHVIGTTKALEYGKLEGSISTIAMILSAIFVSILTPYLIQIIV